MKIKLLLALSLLVTSMYTYADNKVEAAADTEKSTESTKVESPIIIKELTDDFDFIKENIELAITGQGLLVSGTLHVSDMLNRTGSDLGFDKQVFEKAESIEFCSALISHKMAVADPANISVCPFTIAIYNYPEHPEKLYVSYRKPQLAGDAEEVSKEINELMASIVEEATE